MSNPWIQFKELIASTPKWIGKIVSVNATTGKTVVSIPGSTVANIVVSGGETYSIGDCVYVKDGVVTAKAPDLQTVVNIEIS